MQPAILLDSKVKKIVGPNRREKRFKGFFVLVMVLWIAITFFIFMKSKESFANRLTTVVPKEIKGEVSCRWLSYKGKIQICAHPDFDHVSDAIAQKGRWSDCDMLPALWLELPMHERSRGNFLDLGANIGSCSFEMLISTDAYIVSIEANPENFRRLQKTVSNLSNKFKERIKIYNVAASNVIENVQIFGAVKNMGNSVVGKAVEDDANQVFHESLSIQTQRLDDILGNVHFSAMKMDVQGYECRALEGMNKIISNIRTIKFEVANRWLLAQGCSDVTLFEKLKNFGFDIFHGNTKLDKPIAQDVYDLVAKNKRTDKIERSFSSSQERLSRYSLFHPNTHGAPESANAWYQNNVEPAITCSHEERIGAAGEGGKWMCDLDALRDKKDCLIYSIGSNNDFSWESAVKARVPNCEIHVFDHTVKNATNKPENVFFHKWGLTAEKVPNANPNLRSLSEISNALGHKDKRVDVFKIDCEGCEWDTHMTWFNSDLQIEEILVETHHGTANPSPNSRAKQFFTHLHESGYRIFHKEPNVHYSGGSGLCVEFGFRRI